MLSLRPLPGLGSLLQVAAAVAQAAFEGGVSGLVNAPGVRR